MKITKELVKEFIDTVPLEIHYNGDKISVVGIRYGFCKETDELWGHKTVMEILNLLETNRNYQSLLPITEVIKDKNDKKRN